LGEGSYTRNEDLLWIIRIRLDPLRDAPDLRLVPSTTACRFGLLALLVALAACADQKEGLDPTTSRPGPTDGYRRAAYVSVSNENPRIGDTVIVAVRVGGADSALGIGSFKVRLTHDASLAYLDEVPTPDFLRAVNPTDSQITVAGATASPATQTLIFAARMIVRGEHALDKLDLQVDELTNAALKNELPTLRRVPGIHLERSLSTLR